MKWILVPIVAIVAVGLLVTIIGMTLPAAHVASRRARFLSNPQVVFDTISDPNGWRTGVHRIESVYPINGRERWKEIDKDENGVTYELVESTRPLRRVTRIVDENLPYSGTWTLEIAPAPGGSTLSITERGEVKNPIFRFVSRFVMGHHRTIDTYLRDLARKLGEPLEIEK
jgi:hypothetical protein